MTKIPKYRKHSTRDLGFVEIRVGGKPKRSYFPGRYKSPESRKAYADFIKKLADADTKTDTLDFFTAPEGISISMLVVKFLDWAETHYQKNGRSTGNYERFRGNITPPLLDLFGDLPVAKFGPLALKKVREKFVEAGLCRTEVNRRTSRVAQIFRWGVENELVSESVAGALRYVTGLREGETTARETEPIKPVADEVVAATLPHLPPTIDDMVRIQRLAGCRPSEVCNLRWCDIDQSDDVWVYTPWEHKMQHKKKARHIAITPGAQEILEKYRHRPAEEYIFSPRETVRLISERKRAARKTPVQPSQVKRGAKAAKKPPRHNERYSTRAYELAIDRAAIRAGAEPWSPNQLRHAFATEARDQHDAETAQMLLGHSSLKTTEIYAEKSMRKIKEAARKMNGNDVP